jgi:nucleoside phosphorylase
VLTAKAEELRDVKVIFDAAFKRLDRGGDAEKQTVYLIPGRPRSPERRLLATTCDAMGSLHAAVRTAQLVGRYTPSLMLFVGTAASLRPGKVRLGDVIVPETAWMRIYDKIVEAPQQAYQDAVARQNFRERFFNDHVLLATSFSEDLSQAARDYVSDVDFSAVEATLDDADLPAPWASELKRKPRVIDDTGIANCGMVVNSETYRDFLLETADRKIDAIDMESYGFFKALRDLNRTATAGLMIRGISDYAGRKEGVELGPTKWKQIANKNAARVALAMVRGIALREY